MFGSLVYVHNLDNDKGELRAFKGILFGYTNRVKRYRI